MNSTQLAIHDNSLKILETIGFKVMDKRILAKLAEKDFRIEDKKVYFTKTQVMDALSACPSSFELTARNPDKSIVLGKGQTNMAPGYGATFLTEADGTQRDATFRDFINFAKLTQTSGCLEANGGILVQPIDLDVDVCYPLMLYATIMLSDLPLIGISAREREIRHCLQLAEIAFGGKDKFCSKYHILSLLNPVTPLQLGEYSEETLLLSVEYNQPVIITSGIGLGSTAPVTIAGALSLGNAEILATITILQALKKGLPVVYGLGGTVLDMKCGATYLATPINERFSSFARKMAIAYNLPSRNGCSMNDAKYFGYQSIVEGTIATMNTITDINSISLHSAGILESFKAMSYEQFMMDCENIRTIRKALEPIDVSEEALAYEAIKEEGIGGSFLSSEHTLENFREYTWESRFAPLTNISKESIASADKNFLERIQTACREQLENHVRPEFNADIRKKLEEYLINTVGADKSKIDEIFS